jgi:hypothetical protein
MTPVVFFRMPRYSNVPKMSQRWNGIDWTKKVGDELLLDPTAIGLGMFGLETCVLAFVV